MFSYRGETVVSADDQSANRLTTNWSVRSCHVYSALTFTNRNLILVYKTNGPAVVHRFCSFVYLNVSLKVSYTAALVLSTIPPCRRQ